MAGCFRFRHSPPYLNNGTTLMALINLSDYDLDHDFSATPAEMNDATDQVRKDFTSGQASASFTAGCLYCIWQRTVYRFADAETYLWFCNLTAEFFESADHPDSINTADARLAPMRSPARRRANGEITFLTFVRVILDLRRYEDLPSAQRFANAMEWIDEVFGGEDDLEPAEIAYNINLMGGFDLTSDGSLSNLPTPDNYAARMQQFSTSAA